jgi:hypothetical protein
LSFCIPFYKARLRIAWGFEKDGKNSACPYLSVPFMKIISYNVNGLRAAIKKAFATGFKPIPPMSSASRK